MSTRVDERRFAAWGAVREPTPARRRWSRAICLAALLAGCAGPSIPEQSTDGAGSRAGNAGTSGGAGTSSAGTGGTLAIGTGGSNAGTGGATAAGNGGATAGGTGGLGAASGNAGTGGVAGGPIADVACDFSSAGTDCILCGGSACIDTASDENHCGACGHACEPGVACVDGQCGRTIVTGTGSYSPGVLLGGRLFAWGTNNYVGVWGSPGGPAAVYEPHEVVAMGNDLVTAVTGDATCAINAKGALRCMGVNHAGQLANGDTNGPDLCSDPQKLWCHASPVDTAVTGLRELRAGMFWCGGTHLCARRADRSVVCWGDESTCDPGDQPIVYPVAVDGLPPSAGLAVSDGSACSRSCNGTVSCWGNNDSYELGRDTSGKPAGPAVVPGVRVTALVAGHHRYCGIREDRTVLCWGQSTDGQSGVVASATLPVAVGGLSDVIQVSLGLSTSCALTSNGEVSCLGQQTLVGSSIASPPGCVGGKCPVPVKASISGVVEIGSAGPCTMARLTDGKYWAWGSGESGMLGNGSTKDTLEPVEVKGLKAP